MIVTGAGVRVSGRVGGWTRAGWSLMVRASTPTSRDPAGVSVVEAAGMVV